jgi:hypothetical protein
MTHAPAPLPTSRHTDPRDRTTVIGAHDVVELRRRWPFWTISHARDGQLVERRWPYWTHAAAVDAHHRMLAHVAAATRYQASLTRLRAVVDQLGDPGMAATLERLHARTAGGRVPPAGVEAPRRPL